jgi:hypothetical protein
VLANSIIAGNTEPAGLTPDLAPPTGGAILSAGYNLIGSVGTTDFSGNATGDRYGDPNGTTIPNAGAIESATTISVLLGPLANNGGPTPTHALLAGSPALDHGDPATTVSVDQRGQPRPIGGGYDIGAFEAVVFTVWDDDDFSTGGLVPPGSADGWSPFGQDNAQGWPGYDPATGSYFGAVTTATANYRITGAISNPGIWMPYSVIGTGNHVRAKYFIFTSGQANPSQGNSVPCMRLRVSNRFAVNSMLEVFNHLNSDPQIQPWSQELRPSADPTSPSLYRVDMDPVDVPYLAANPATEGILRAFEAFSTDPQDNGAIMMTESVIGTYPANALGASAPVKVFQTSASGAGDLSTSAPDSQLVRYSALAQPSGVFPVVDFAKFPAYSEGTGGVTFDSVGFNNTDGGFRIGIIVREFGAGADLAQRVRVEPDRQYTVRFHATGTQQSNRQPQFRMRARSVRFMWVQKLELGGAWATNGAQNHAIASQSLPGVGCQNPDKIATENGGWYTLMLHTPMSADIRADQTGPLAARMPLITSQPGPGVNAASYRDLKVGADLLDTLSFGPNAPTEVANITIDRIEIRSHELVAD